MKSVRVTVPTVYRSIFIGDIHVPFHDHVAVKLLVEFLKWFQPQRIYLIGDVVDFYPLSRFDRDPARIGTLQIELDECVDLFTEIRDICPHAEMFFREGNHEKRLTRYLWQHDEIESLRCLDIKELLNLEELHIEHIEYNGHLDHYRSFLVEHGDLCRKHSGYTARAMMEKRQLSGICGHTHRLGAHYQTDHAGQKVWYENGCLCRLDPEYIVGKPNWQQGFTIAHNWENRFQVEQVPVMRGRIFCHGRLWEAVEEAKPEKQPLKLVVPDLDPVPKASSTPQESSTVQKKPAGRVPPRRSRQKGNNNALKPDPPQLPPDGDGEPGSRPGPLDGRGDGDDDFLSAD